MSDPTPTPDRPDTPDPQPIGAVFDEYDMLGRSRVLVMQADIARALARRLNDDDLSDRERTRWQRELAALLSGLQDRPERLLAPALRPCGHRFRPTPHPYDGRRDQHDRRIRPDTEGDR